MLLRNPNPDLLSVYQEDEFLPPVSGWTIFGGVFLVSTVALAFLVSAFTPLPVTVKAPAMVRPNGEVKLVQAPNEGTVINIDAKENQTVTQGKPLVILDSSRFNTRKSQLEVNIRRNFQQSGQISQQLNSLGLQLSAETEKIKRAVATSEADYLRVQKEYNEKSLTVSAQVNEAKANLQVAQEELRKTHSDFNASKASLKSSQSTLRISQEKRDRYENAAQEGALGKDQLAEAQLAVEQQQQTVAERTALLQSQRQTIARQKNTVESGKARLQVAFANLNPSDGVVKMAKEKIAQEKANGQGNLARLNQERNSLLQRQSELQKQLESDRQELSQVQRDIVKTIVTAPISGIILKLNLRNNNQTVRVGEEIAQIAPSNVPLVIKAKVSTQDIGKVKIGQPSQMRVSAYPYPDYGVLKGIVMEISPDAITPQNFAINSANSRNVANNNAFPYYEVTIKPERLYLKDDLKNSLQVGMEIQADIIYRSETVLKFILRKARLLTDL
jgi:multidrug efflux pump subunit AcrA (membrane-fusion protein)